MHACAPIAIRHTAELQRKQITTQTIKTTFYQHTTHVVARQALHHSISMESTADAANMPGRLRPARPSGDTIRLPHNIQAPTTPFRFVTILDRHSLQSCPHHGGQWQPLLKCQASTCKAVSKGVRFIQPCCRISDSNTLWNTCHHSCSAKSANTWIGRSSLEAQAMPTDARMHRPRAHYDLHLPCGRPPTAAHR